MIMIIGCERAGKTYVDPCEINSRGQYTYPTACQQALTSIKLQEEAAEIRNRNKNIWSLVGLSTVILLVLTAMIIVFWLGSSAIKLLIQRWQLQNEKFKMENATIQAQAYRQKYSFAKLREGNATLRVQAIAQRTHPNVPQQIDIRTTDSHDITLQLPKGSINGESINDVLLNPEAITDQVKEITNSNLAKMVNPKKILYENDIVVGVQEDGELYKVAPQNIGSLMIGGDSGWGKTSIGIIVGIQFAIQTNGWILPIDPHAANNQSMSYRMRPFEAYFARRYDDDGTLVYLDPDDGQVLLKENGEPIFDTHNDVKDGLLFALYILEKRKTEAVKAMREARKNSRRYEPKEYASIFIMFDEIVSILGSIHKTIARQVLEKVTLEGRKYGIFIEGVMHYRNATKAGGGVHGFQSSIIVKTSNESAQKQMPDVDKDSLPDMGNLKIGQYVFYSRGNPVQVLSMPKIDDNILSEYAQDMMRKQGRKLAKPFDESKIIDVEALPIEADNQDKEVAIPELLEAMEEISKTLLLPEKRGEVAGKCNREGEVVHTSPSILKCEGEVVGEVSEVASGTQLHPPCEVRQKIEVDRQTYEIIQSFQNEVEKKMGKIVYEKSGGQYGKVYMNNLDKLEEVLKQIVKAHRFMVPDKGKIHDIINTFCQGDTRLSKVVRHFSSKVNGGDKDYTKDTENLLRTMVSQCEFRIV